MSTPIISVENLGKRYTIRHEGGGNRYQRLSEELVSAVKAPLKHLRSRLRGSGHEGQLDHRKPTKGPSEEDFWALRNISFDVRAGEVVGIIGRNGAGKSTLLKVLSRITEPSEGRIHLRGRIASLLEVGTGFHPELTGRENIFLNGAILGMTRAEIKAKFVEIVSFAEVEQFLDTPVKRYSSGMYVRLAFAVAAHLEPEILVVDEVLAVGDAEFQKKCLGKMRSVSEGGRTVLFVSHQMSAVQNLCERGLLFSRGRLIRTGTMSEVVRDYLEDTTAVAESSLDGRHDRKGTGALRFTGVSFRRDAQLVRSFCCGERALLNLAVHNSLQTDLRAVRISVGFDNRDGARVLTLSTHLVSGDIPSLSPGRHVIRLVMPRLTIAPGRYTMTLYASVGGETADWVLNAGMLEVQESDFYGGGHLIQAGPGQGVFLMEHAFELIRADAGEKE